MLETFADVFFIIAKIFAIYFGIISIFALIKPKQTPETEKRLKFAVLIPARNERSCIAGIIDSIKRQNYPSDCADVIVIPNNCTDDTAAVARDAGAKIMDMPPSVCSKGAALREAMARLCENSDYDAFCVFDADNEADENFLEAMNRTLCAGARVAKSRILSKNRGQSWVCACYEIYFCVANQFMNRARNTLGLSARLIGTGFAVRRDFIEEIGGWNTETITEDAEFYAICAARGETIAFCEKAVTYDEEPLSFKTSVTQRKRWMSGVMQVAQLKAPELIRGLNRTTSFFTSLDTSLQFSFAYIQALLPIFFLLSFAASPSVVLSAAPLSIALGYLGALANAVLALALEKRLSGKMIVGILMYPLFMFSFIPLQTISLFKRTTVWHETRHTGVRRYAPIPATRNAA